MKMIIIKALKLEKIINFKCIFYTKKNNYLKIMDKNYIYLFYYILYI